MDSENNNGYRDVEGISKEDYYYKPHKFLRSHCKQGDREDSNTTIWDVAFEPGRPDRVATCGGPFLCIIDLKSGELLKKYSHKNQSHEFFCMAWTTISNNNFVALGSSCGEVRLIHPRKLVAFDAWTPKKRQSVNALKFQEKEPGWLFIASSCDGNGVVSLWDIHSPTPPEFSNSRQTFLMEISVDDCTLYCMSWVEETGWLLVGGDEGLLGWRVREEKVRETCFPKYSPRKVYLNLPGTTDEDGPIVDSITSLGRGLVAAKCVGKGKILVFSADFDVSEKSTESVIHVLAKFRWVTTDEFYLNIGGDVSTRMMGCGDETGNVWIYCLPDWLCEKESPFSVRERCLKQSGFQKIFKRPKKYSPLGRLPWPREILPEHKDKVFINKVSFSPCSKFIVAATDKNLIAIWKKKEFRSA